MFLRNMFDEVFPAAASLVFVQHTNTAFCLRGIFRLDEVFRAAAGILLFWGKNDFPGSLSICNEVVRSS